MKSIWLLAFGIVLAQETTSVVPTTNMTAEVTTAEVTTAEVTTAEVTTPETTTAAAVTTTPAPETTAPVTTAAPETTTAADVTTASPVTTAAPAPQDNIIRIKDGNLTCIMAKFEGNFTLSNGNSTETHVMQTEGATVGSGSSCQLQTAVVAYNDASLTFVFNHTTVNDGAKNVTTWDIQTMKLTYDNNEYEPIRTLEGMRAHAGSSYSCIVGFSTIMQHAGNESEINATLTLNQIRIEYGIDEIKPITDDTKFTKAESCAADMTQSLLVPIIVACALAGLVLAICVAYIIGRRRTYSGYSAM